MKNHKKQRAIPGGPQLMRELRKTTASVVGVLHRAAGEEERLSCLTLREERDQEEGAGLSGVDWKNLKESAALIKELTGIVRNLYGIPTESDALAYELSLEKLRTAQEKGGADLRATVVELQMAGGNAMQAEELAE